MQPSSLELLAALFEGEERANPTRCRCRRGQEQAELPSVRGPAGRKRNCHCGRCAECVDNARWDRIFNEKFADPDYYAPRYVRYSSPISSL